MIEYISIVKVKDFVFSLILAIVFMVSFICYSGFQSFLRNILLIYGCSVIFTLQIFTIFMIIRFKDAVLNRKDEKPK